MIDFPLWRRRAQAPAPIELDFVPIRRAPGLLGWALLAVGVLCVVVEVQGLLAVREDLAERASIVDALRKQASVALPRTPAAQPLAAHELAGALRVSARLGADWSEVFSALARVRGNDVAWVEVEMAEARGATADSAGQAAPRAPGGSRRGLRLAGDARSLDAVLKVVDRMRREPALAGVELVSHEATASNGVAFVRFVVATRTQGAS